MNKHCHLKPTLFISIVLFFLNPLWVQAQWLCPWEQRQEIQIKEKSNNDLTNYQVKIEVPFTTGMNADYSDLRFTSEDGISLLNYYIETFTSTSAIVWVKIPFLEAKEKVNLYMYYCNPDATSASDPANTFIFFDDFDSVSGWTDVGSGTVVQDTTTFPGVTTVMKDDNCDPSGAYKTIGQTLNSFRLITREIRNNSGAGCTLNRYGLEGTGFNGYGIRRSASGTGNGDFGFERRNNGNGQGAQQTNLSQPRGNWYRVELTRCYEDLEDLEDDITNAIIYDDDKVIIGNESGSDGTYTEFDKVVIRGGRPYHLDFMAVANFICEEPEIKFKKLENDEPEIVCQDITVELDENGSLVFDASLVIASSVDCNDLTFTSNVNSFDCMDIGNNDVKITATDDHGNEANCESTVTVEDNLPPMFNCPGNITIDANATGCLAIVNWPIPNVTDNCSAAPTLSSDHNSGDSFPEGTTLVTYQAVDEWNNMSECTFTITVISTADIPLINIDETSGVDKNDGIICEGDQFCLTAPNGYSNYIWNAGSSSNPYCGTTGGIYNLTVSDDLGCTAISTDVTITSNELPIAGTCNLINDYCLENLGSVQLQASNGSAPYQVNWIPAINGANSAAITNSGEFVNINNIPGGTTIEFSVVDQNGCTTN